MAVKKIFLFMLVLVLVSGCAAEAHYKTTTAVVSRIVDGDTLVTEDGRTIRLLHINTPEKGRMYSQEASDMLKSLVLGRNVTLERDAVDRDQYDRLLRYIYLNGTLVNLELVKSGLAHTYFVPPNLMHEKEFLEAEKLAKSQHIGLWNLSKYSECIGIVQFHYDAEGDDSKNLNDEYVILRNICNLDISVKGWALADETRKEFALGNFFIRSGQDLTVYSGPGENSESSLYLSETKAIWNNDRDSLFLYDAQRKLVLYYSYNNS